MCFIRKGLDWVFTRHELKWLDDIMPESHKREKEDKKKDLNDGDAEEGGGEVEHDSHYSYNNTLFFIVYGNKYAFVLSV